MSKTEKIVKTVTKGRKEWGTVKHEWIQASFLKYRVAKRDYEQTMDEVYTLLLKNGYDVI